MGSVCSWGPGVPGSAVLPGPARLSPGCTRTKLQDSPVPGLGSFQECPPNPIRTQGERLPCPKEPSSHKGPTTDGCLNQVPRTGPKSCLLQHALGEQGAAHSGGQVPFPPARWSLNSAPEGRVGTGALHAGLLPWFLPFLQPRARPGPPAWSAGAIYRGPAESRRAPLPTGPCGTGAPHGSLSEGWGSGRL